MAAGVTFTSESAGRIARSVKKTEAMRLAPPKGNRPNGGYNRDRLCKLVDVSPAVSGELAKGAVGTFEIWNGPPGSETASGVEFEACAKFGGIPNTSVFCMASSNGWGFYVHVRECTTEEEEA